MNTSFQSLFVCIHLCMIPLQITGAKTFPHVPLSLPPPPPFGNPPRRECRPPNTPHQSSARSTPPILRSRQPSIVLTSHPHSSPHLLLPLLLQRETSRDAPHSLLRLADGVHPFIRGAGGYQEPGDAVILSLSHFSLTSIALSDTLCK